MGWADVSRRAALGALIALATGTTAAAQSYPAVRANAVIPNPRPAAPLADWVNAKGRVTLTLAAPGAILRGWSYAGTDPKAPTVVFFGGSADTIERDDASLRALAALGPSVVAYDYRGYGFSVGLSDVARMQEDALRIVNAVAQTAGARGVVVYGYSFGTAMAASARVTDDGRRRDLSPRRLRARKKSWRPRLRPMEYRRRSRRRSHRHPMRSRRSPTSISSGASKRRC